MTIRWAAKFKSLDKLVEFDVWYLVRRTGDEPRIILFISRQDEEKAMKELGLLNAA